MAFEKNFVNVSVIHYGEDFDRKVINKTLMIRDSLKVSTFPEIFEWSFYRRGRNGESLLKKYLKEDLW